MEGSIIKKPPDRCIAFSNKTNQIWSFKNHTQIADVRGAIDVEQAKICKLYRMDAGELENFKPRDTEAPI